MNSLSPVICDVRLKMTSLYISTMLWGLVALIVTNKQSKQKEQRALIFFTVLAVVFTLIGVFTFRVEELSRWSMTSAFGLLFFISLCFRLHLMSQLVKVQSETDNSCRTFLDIDLSKIEDKSIIKKYKRVNSIFWLTAIIYLISNVLEAMSVSI